MDSRGSFDPYLKWLGIHPKDQPPHHYRLLGIDRFESDPEIISNAADARMAHVRTFQSGRHAEASQRLLNEIAAAKVTLLTAEKRAAYDEALRAEILAQTPAKPDPVAPAPPTQVPPPLPRKPSPRNGGQTALPPVQVGAPSTPLSRDWRVWAGAAALVLLLAVSAIAVASLGGWRSVASADEDGATTEDGDPSASGEEGERQKDALPGRPEQDDPGEAPDAKAPGSETGSGEAPISKPDTQSPAPAAPGPKTEAADPADANTPAGTDGAAGTATEPEPGADPDAMTEAKTAGKTETPEAKGETAPGAAKTEGAKPKPDAPAEKAKAEPAAEKPQETEIVRLPVPTEAQQSRAEATVRALFEDELEEADTPAEKLALANKLFQQALGTADNPPARYVLFRMALDMASSTGELARTLDGVDEMARYYEIDWVRMKADLLERAMAGMRGARNPVLLASEITDNALSVIDDAIAEDRFDIAHQVLKLALPASRRSGNAEYAGEVAARGRLLQVLEREYEPVREALVKLRADPDDPQPNYTLGRWYCFIKGQWERGLPHLVKADIAGVDDLARTDLAGPADAQSQVALAERWLTFAEIEKENARPQVQLRARYWLKKALPALSGLSQTAAEKQIEKLAKVEPLFKPRQRGAVEPGNVALARRGANAEGPDATAAYLIDGVNKQVESAGLTVGKCPCEWTITLKQVYSLREIRLLLYDNKRTKRFYWYAIATSPDGKEYAPLVDRSSGQWFGWQVIRFPARPVKAIRLFGLNKSGKRIFYAIELEAYCVPPKTAPGAPTQPGPQPPAKPEPKPPAKPEPKVPATPEPKTPVTPKPEPPATPTANPAPPQPGPPVPAGGEAPEQESATPAAPEAAAPAEPPNAP